MLKIKKLFLIICMIFMLVPNSISAYEVNSNILVNITNAINEINASENTNVHMTDYCVLYDVEMNPSYLIIYLNNGGYVIISKENGIISEYNLQPYKLPYSIKNENQVLVYGGPFTYITKDKASSKLYKNMVEVEVSSEMIQKNKEFLRLKRDTSNDISRETRASWVSLDESRFSRYSSGLWINNNSNYPTSQGYPSRGICGTIAAAILLAYYDDYVDNSIVPNSIRTQGSTRPGLLVSTLFNYIDKNSLIGSTPASVATGIKAFYNNYAPSGMTNHVPYSGEISTFPTAKTVINRGRPLAICLLSINGAANPYGNHFLVAYGYLDDSGTVADKYRVVDEWGSYNAVINVSWSSGYVYLYN